jgi:ribosomal protein L11 methyltransferase
MTDYILELSFDARDEALEDEIHLRLFLTALTGSSSVERNGTVTVSAYFDTDAARNAAEAVFADLDVEVHRTERARVDWLEHYQQSLEPLFIGERFVVAPDAALIPRDTARMAIVVPQEQAFGTGSHETTSLCIEALEALDVRGARGLDIGSGSGILAIAMLRLGATRAIAFDNDLDAYGALRDNRIRNDIDDARMPLFIGGVDAMRGGRFDVVTMNIIPEVIVPLLPDVVRFVAGPLILSGILVVKRDDVVAACAEHRLRLVDERERGEWWAGTFR